MDQRFLAIDVFAVGHRGKQDRRVRVIGHRHNHRVKLVAVLGKRLAVVAAGERLGMVVGGICEVVGIDVTQPGDLHIGVAGDLRAVRLANRADHADGQDAEFAVRRGGAGTPEPEGTQAEACGGGGLEEMAAA